MRDKKPDIKGWGTLRYRDALGKEHTCRTYVDNYSEARQLAEDLRGTFVKFEQIAEEVQVHATT